MVVTLSGVMAVRDESASIGQAIESIAPREATCCRCKQSKPISQFPKNKSNPRGFSSICLVCKREYGRLRYRKIQEGTWNPTRQRIDFPDATRQPTETEIAWAAGFLEGDGCFTSDGHETTVVVTASQTDVGPLHFLQEIFGGWIRHIKHNGFSGSPIYTWQLSGYPAAKVILAVFPYIRTEDKRNKIRLLIEIIKRKPWSVEFQLSL